MFKNKSPFSHQNNPSGQICIKQKGIFSQALAHKGPSFKKNKENSFEDHPIGRERGITQEISLECNQVLISPKPDKNYDKGHTYFGNTVEKDNRGKRIKTKDRQHSDLDLLCTEQFLRNQASNQQSGGSEDRVIERLQRILKAYQERDQRKNEYIAYLQGRLQSKAYHH